MSVGAVRSAAAVESDAFGSILRRARAGDHDAITELYGRHHRRLLRVLRAEVGDAAEDVASQTWLEVIGALRRFEGDERGFQSLLYTIGRRRVADHRRTLRRRPSTPTAPEDLHGMPDAGTPVDRATLDGLAGDDAARRVTEILGPDAAEIVLLRVVAGMTVEQVAKIVGKSPGAVRVQQHRALRKLADALGERSDDGGCNRCPAAAIGRGMTPDVGPEAADHLLDALAGMPIAGRADDPSLDGVAALLAAAAADLDGSVEPPPQLLAAMVSAATAFAPAAPRRLRRVVPIAAVAAGLLPARGSRRRPDRSPTRCRISPTTSPASSASTYRPRLRPTSPAGRPRRRRAVSTGSVPTASRPARVASCRVPVRTAVATVWVPTACRRSGWHRARHR